MLRTGIRLADAGKLPDTVIRFGIRRWLGQRLREQRADDLEYQAVQLDRWVEHLKASPVALLPDTANEQHYEVPAAFFEMVLGPRLKYSSSYYESKTTSLAEAELAMLRLTCERAGITDGMRVLDLGCGWGALSLYIAEHFPGCEVHAVSNSASQGDFVRAQAQRLGATNVTHHKADMNDFTIDGPFDRVVSVEMLEHLRNYQTVLRRVASWLGPEGKLFVHIFCHRRLSYPFEVQDETDWMSRYFFQGGQMPAEGLLPRFQDDLTLEQQWTVPGTHYQRTLEDWLRRLDAQRPAVRACLMDTYGPAEVDRWVQRWRLFLLACAELFGYRQGSEWYVAHYLFRNPQGVEA